MNQIANALYELLEPEVLKVLQHYREDFTLHDRRLFNETAVQGLEYLVAVRSSGTQVIPLGLAPDANANHLASTATTFLRASAGRKPVVRQLTRKEAQALLSQSGGVDTKAHGAHNLWDVEVTANGAKLATARIRLHPNSLSGSAQADIGVELRPGLSAAKQVLAETSVHQRVNRLAGTLFWTVRSLTINQQDRQQWFHKLHSPAQEMALT